MSDEKTTDRTARHLARWAGLMARLEEGLPGYGPHDTEQVCAVLEQALRERDEWEGACTIANKGRAAALEERDALAQEVERLRLLVERFVRNASNGRERAPRWVHVTAATGHGSTAASALCVEFGVDPAEDAGIRQPYPGECCPFCGEEVPLD